MPHPYSKRYYPAVPAVEVALGTPDADLSLGPVLSIIDTGADISLVPGDHLMRLGAPVVGSGVLSSPWGEKYPVKIYEINVRVEGHDLLQVEVASEPGGREVVLGRNILNQLILSLDGPAETVTLLSHG